MSKGLECSTLHWRLRRLPAGPPNGACARRLALGRWHFLSLVQTVSTRATRKSFLTPSVTSRSDEFRVVGTARASQGKRERTYAMLRITVHQNPESCTFQLEVGGWQHRWVREVEECRRRHSGRPPPAVRPL